MLFLLTIFGPQLLGALRTVVSNPPNCRNWKEVACCILLIVLSPFHMYVEHFKLAYLEMKLKINPNDKLLILKKESLKRALHIHVKLELGLETVYQMTGQLILLLMAYTKTPTQSGLESMFKNGEGFEPKTLFLLVISILLSIYSCVSSHWKALTACREHFPCKSRFISGLYCFFGCLIRVVAIIMFFAGPLGLFSLLRHLQGEQYPWHSHVLDLVNPDGTIVLGNNPPFEWDLIAYRPKDYTDYVGLRLKYYLMIFLANTGIQVLAIFIAKSILSKVFWHEFNFLEKVIHCIENSNIPYNAKEWDDGKGNANEHKKRMRSNWCEVFAVIIINAIFNLLLLTPLIYLGKSLESSSNDSICL